VLFKPLGWSPVRAWLDRGILLVGDFPTIRVSAFYVEIKTNLATYRYAVSIRVLNLVSNEADFSCLS